MVVLFALLVLRQVADLQMFSLKGGLIPHFKEL